MILITSHDDAVGSVGYVLNKPSPLRVEELQVLGAASGELGRKLMREGLCARAK